MKIFPLAPAGFVLVAASFFVSCSSENIRSEKAKSQSASGKPVVYATNYPLFYFAQRIGGDLIDLRCPPVEEAGDPAFWKPSDEVIVAMQQAGRILLNGATYEKWLATASLPEAALVDTSAAFSGEFLASGEVVVHSHGPGGEHSHGGTAFTTWMDFQQALWQAEEVKNALQELDPQNEHLYNENYEKLADDIDALHQECKSIGKSLETVPLVASHPVYQYFARRYGLAIEAVLWEPETAPDEDEMGQLTKILEKHPAKWMIWEGEPIKESIALLEEHGLKSVVVDPCGNLPEQGDWLSVMQENLANLKTLTP